MRCRGAIPELRSTRIPHQMVIFDTEAYRGMLIDNVETQSFRMGVMRYLEIDDELKITNDMFFITKDHIEFIDIIERLTKKDKPLYAYCHNIKYDLMLLNVLPVLLNKGWKIDKVILEDPPIYIVVSNNRKKIHFVDTFNYFQTSVEAMGKQLGLPKLELPGNDDSDERMETYCRRDVEVLSEYLINYMRFLYENDLAPFAITIASQAFRAYRARFMRKDIFIHNDERVIALERKSYKGGRTEAFYIGQLPHKTYYKVDVNSMYPYVMKIFKYPVELVAFSTDYDTSKLEQLINEYYVIAEVTLDTDENAFAITEKNKLVYPVGVFRSFLHHAELEHALRINAIKKIHQIAIYRKENIFDEYIDFFYQIKSEAEAEGNMSKRSMAKLFLNSLYGKFGQRNVTSKIIQNDSEYIFNRVTGFSETLNTRVEVNYLGNQLEIRYSQGESYYSFPAIAGSVTAYARMYLYRLMTKCGKDHVFYMDTDSMIVDEVGLNNIRDYLDNRELGMMKIEDQSENVVINGLKDYVFGNEIKLKGVPKKAVKIAENIYQYQQFEGIKTYLKNGCPEGVRVTLRTKQRKSKYDKGIVLDTGRVIPLQISNDHP